ncbi:MAG: CopG family transcriptional regulator [Nanoarchaeota archaeon]
MIVYKWYTKEEKISKKIVITLPNETYKLMKKLEGMGDKDAEIARNLIISWMAEKSMISTSAKEKMKQKR